MLGDLCEDWVQCLNFYGYTCVKKSETVQDALVGFPVGIEADFAAMFTEVTAAEIFRNLDIDANGDTTTRYGIEGLFQRKFCILQNVAR